MSSKMKTDHVSFSFPSVLRCSKSGNRSWLTFSLRCQIMLRRNQPWHRRLRVAQNLIDYYRELTTKHVHLRVAQMGQLKVSHDLFSFLTRRVTLENENETWSVFIFVELLTISKMKMKRNSVSFLRDARQIPNQMRISFRQCLSRARTMTP